MSFESSPEMSLRTRAERRGMWWLQQRAGCLPRCKRGVHSPRRPAYVKSSVKRNVKRDVNDDVSKRGYVATRFLAPFFTSFFTPCFTSFFTSYFKRRQFVFSRYSRLGALLLSLGPMAT